MDNASLKFLSPEKSYALLFKLKNKNKILY